MASRRGIYCNTHNSLGIFYGILFYTISYGSDLHFIEDNAASFL